MTWWLVLLAISLAIRHECIKRERRVSGNKAAHIKSGPRYEQDRPYAECFDEMEDDL